MNKKTKEEKHGFPAVLSALVPGVGQIVKGEVGRGLLIIAGTILGFLLMILLIGFVLTPILYVWQIYDAYNR